MGTSDASVNILMVDDQPAKLVSYEAILADLDVSLIKAASARAALEQLLKHEIAIVLMDVSMPEIDGFELATMIRQHPRFQRTAIIFISAVRLTDLDRLKGYEVGAVDYIPVPVIPEILRAKVAAFAELYRTTRELAELNRDLERRVEERTAALEKALVARDEFLSVAAHELKTPLTGLRATAQVLTRKMRRSDVQRPDWLDQGLNTVDQQADRLARLVEQLLDVSRLDQNKLAAERAPTDLSTLTERLVGSFRARSRKHSIKLEAAPDLVADVDADSIERVLSNLLDNAIKYSPDGGQIDVELRSGTAEQVRLAVRDRGIGIPPEKREAIFERFYQAHAEDHRSGLGLGLYISHEIIVQHDGQLVVEFPPDGGTCFVVLLPVHANATEPASAPVTQA
ncbi:MAG TPA: hybrid sensor histidine kinase/response regulator [Ktedonobacterales bacterium]